MSSRGAVIVSPPSLLLVTGASSFVGAHIVVQLLDAGYRVRGTARGAKLRALKEHFESNPDFQAISVEDIVTADLSSALEDVSAVLHVACPIANGGLPPAEMIKGAVEGTLNVLRQALAAGVHKVILTGSWSAFVDPDHRSVYTGVTVSEEDWGKTSAQELMTGTHHPLYVYSGAKILAEKAAWKFAEEHPELDLASINPPFLYGPYIMHPGPNPLALGSNILLYALIAGAPGRPLPRQQPPFYMHVRDAARAHLLALALPKLSLDADVRQKRFSVVAPEITLWSDTVRYLRARHPELQGRLPEVEDDMGDGAPGLPGPLCKNDTTRAAMVLGLREYVGWEETVDETVKALLEVEVSWKQS